MRCASTSPRGLGRKIAVAEALAIGAQHATGTGDARRWVHPPASRGRRHEHHSSRGTCFAERLEAEQQAEAAAGKLVLDSRVERRLGDRHLVPVDLEFLGQHHRQRVPYSLADLGVLGIQGDVAIRRDLDQRMQLGRGRLPDGPAVFCSSPQPDEKSATGSRGQQQEGPTIHASHETALVAMP